MYEDHVDLPDGLLRETKRVAGRERTTLRALIEQGLRAAPSVCTRRAFALRIKGRPASARIPSRDGGARGAVARRVE